MSAIIVSLGNIHTSMLGCYGGPWLETPALDSFATNGFVFDQCYIECPSPEITRRNWWTGRLQYSALSDVPTDSATIAPNLIARLQASGVRTVLITDTGGLMDQSQDTSGFDEVVEIALEEEDATQDVFDAAINWLSHYSTTSPFLLFVDCYGAHQPIRIEIDEPESERADGDQIAQGLVPRPEDSFLAVVSHLDQQCGRFLEWLQCQPYWDRSLVGFTSDVGCVAESRHPDRGFPFDLSEWRTHVPLIIRFPNIETMGRSSALVQSIDLIPTVFEALGIALPLPIDGMSLLPVCRGEQKAVRAFVRLTIPGGTRAIRTANWYLIETGQGDTADRHLFAKPDDRWNRDDVAKRYPETVAELSPLLDNA